MKWIDCSLPWAQPPVEIVRMKRPTFKYEDAALLDRSINELDFNIRLVMAEEKRNPGSELAPEKERAREKVAESKTQSIRGRKTSLFASYLEADKYIGEHLEGFPAHARIKYLEECHDKYEVWVETQPEFAMFEKSLDEYDRMMSTSTFTGSGLNRPGTIVEFTNGVRKVIGDVSPGGIPMGEASPWSTEKGISSTDMVKRYAYIYDEEIPVQKSEASNEAILKDAVARVQSIVERHEEDWKNVLAILHGKVPESAKKYEVSPIGFEELSNVFSMPEGYLDMETASRKRGLTQIRPLGNGYKATVVDRIDNGTEYIPFSDPRASKEGDEMSLGEIIASVDKIEQDTGAQINIDELVEALKHFHKLDYAENKKEADAIVAAMKEYDPMVKPLVRRNDTSGIQQFKLSPDEEARFRRAFDLGLSAQEKGLISKSMAELNKYVDSLVALPPEVFNAVESVVAGHSKTLTQNLDRGFAPNATEHAKAELNEVMELSKALDFDNESSDKEEEPEGSSIFATAAACIAISGMAGFLDSRSKKEVVVPENPVETPVKVVQPQLELALQTA